ncbi:MAG: hypothetical protein PHG44_09335 [Lentisphaeria bacterium]|nr:hypothetical protein [Lentisphaeria bacterium]
MAPCVSARPEINRKTNRTNRTNQADRTNRTNRTNRADRTNRTNRQSLVCLRVFWCVLVSSFGAGSKQAGDLAAF